MAASVVEMLVLVMTGTQLRHALLLQAVSRPVNQTKAVVLKLDDIAEES